MKIAMILDNPLNPDNRVEKEASCLAKAGHDVTILCKKEEGLPCEEFRNGYKVKRVFRFNLGTSVLVEKYLEAHFDLMEYINEKFDVYHCHDTETWPIGYILSKRDGAKFICDSHEYFPDYIVSENYTDKFKYEITRLLVLSRGSYIKYADRVITVSDSIADRLHTEYCLNLRPTVLYNTRPITQKVVEKYNLLREEFGIDSDKKIMFFQGNIDFSRGIEYIIKSLKYIKSNVIFIIAGKCSEAYLDELKNVAKENDVLNKFIYLGFLDNEKLLKYTASADILTYYPRNIVENMKYTIPNKFFDYIFAAKPIIIRDLEIYKRFMDNYDFGFACIDVFDVAEKIDLLLNNSDIYDKKVLNCSKAQNELSWEAQEEKLINLYKSF